MEMVSENPLNSQSDFQCLQCFHKIASEKVLEIFNQSESLVKSCHNVSCNLKLLGISSFLQSRNLEDYERVLHQLSASLWPGNHLMIELKSKLSQLYGSDTSKLTKPELQRKLQLLLDLCNCFDKVSLFIGCNILHFHKFLFSDTKLCDSKASIAFI